MPTRFFWAEDFLTNLAFFRTLYIGGRFGGGKTLLAVVLAAYLLERGLVEKVVSNTPVTFAVPSIAPLKNAALVLDESWIYLEKRSSVFLYAAFVRKLNHYLLLPSVWSPHRMFTRFSCYRAFNFFSVGFPAWLYRWSLNNVTTKDRGFFLLVHPEAAFGYFDTRYIPSSDGGIEKSLLDTAVLAGYNPKQRKSSTACTRAGEEREENEELEEVASDIGEAVEDNSRTMEEVTRTLRRTKLH